MSEDAMALIQYIDPEAVREDLAISRDIISDQLAKHSQLAFHYMNIATRCKSQAERMRQMLDLVDSQLDGEYRSAMKESDTKVTEAQIRAAIIKDRRRRVAQQRLIDAETQWSFAQNAKTAFEHRREMLLQTARDLGRELTGNGGMRVTAETNRQRVVDAIEARQKAGASPVSQE